MRTTARPVGRQRLSERTPGSLGLTSPPISLANIVGLVVGATVASIVAFLLLLLFGVSLHPALLVSEGASNAWFIAAYDRRSRRLGWDTLRTRFADIDRPLMLASVAAGLASSVFADAATWILRGVGIK